MGDNSITTQLIRNTPEYQRESPNLQRFLEAAGEFLERTKEKIEQTDFIKDFEVVGLAQLSERLEERGTELPRAMPADFRRDYLKDVADHNAKHGSDSALRFALDTIGLKGVIRRAWLLSPESVGNGLFRDPRTKELKPLPIDRALGASFRTTMVYGDPVVTSDGTYLRGYTYDDDSFENPEDYVIFGENYLNPVDVDEDLVVAKTPYVVVNFESEGFNANTGAYVDPETGEVYEYTASEEAQLVDEIIKFFADGDNRPTTLKMFLIITDRFDDSFGVSDDVHEENFISLTKAYPVLKNETGVLGEEEFVFIGGQWEEEAIPDFGDVIVVDQPRHTETIPNDDMFEPTESIVEKLTNLDQFVFVVDDDDGVVVEENKTLTGGVWFGDEFDTNDELEIDGPELFFVVSEGQIVTLDGYPISVSM